VTTWYLINENSICWALSALRPEVPGHRCQVGLRRLGGRRRALFWACRRVALPSVARGFNRRAGTFGLPVVADRSKPTRCPERRRRSRRSRRASGALSIPAAGGLRLRPSTPFASLTPLRPLCLARKPRSVLW